jgi:hypothetical protein
MEEDLTCRTRERCLGWDEESPDYARQMVSSGIPFFAMIIGSVNLLSRAFRCVFVVGLTILVSLGICGLFLLGKYPAVFFALFFVAALLGRYFERLRQFLRDSTINKDTQRY